MALSPEQINKIDNKLYNIDDIEKEVDESIKEYHGWYPWEEALIDREYPVEVRNKVAKRYIKAGWKYVYHHTSSENDERPGLTLFRFSNDIISHCENGKYHKVVAEGE